MIKAKSYKELEAYKKSYQVALMVYALTKKLPKEELYGMSAQLRRSAISIPSNIAEGYMRGSKEYVHFLKISLGSCAELDTQVLLSKDAGLCTQADIASLLALNTEVIKLLNTYIKGICSHLSNP